MKPVLVVITVPHAFCNERTRNCDEISKEMALKLQTLLKVDGVENKVFLATIPRYECDFNRPYCTKYITFSQTKNQKLMVKSSRMTTFRKRVTDFVKINKKNKRIFVLDLHSYSNSKDHKPGSMLKGWDFYLLSINTSYISNHFVEFMRKRGFKTNSFIADHKNDIIEEFEDFENFLIEFNEDFGKNKKILMGIVSWIESYFVNPEIVSPVSGVIDYVGKDKIGIYIETTDNHNIYSPVNGVPKLNTFQGKILDHNFRSFPNKRGKLIITFSTIKFEVLVGKGFVTDNIRIYKNKKFLRKGERFAEIIFGSYAYVYGIGGIHLKKGLQLNGGKSCLTLETFSTSSKIKDITFKVIKYPSLEFDKVQEELSKLEKICQPVLFEYPYEPLKRVSKILLGYYMGEIIIFLSYTKTDLVLSYVARKGAIKDKNGYFITDVCSDISRYRGLGTTLLEYYIKNIASEVEYSLLWVNPENKRAIRLYEKYGNFKLIDHIDGINIMRRMENFLELKKLVKELKISQTFKEDNLDSLDVFKNLLIVTGKSTNSLLVFDKNSLELKRTKIGDLKRPNGIKIIKNFCFIVERDSHRVSVFRLPSFKLVYRFGSNVLKRPYGIDGIESAIRIFDIYVTDINIVYVFRLNTITGSIEIIRKMGEGILKRTESILILKNKKVLVADEERKKIAVFFKGKYIGDITRDYMYDPEGLAKFDGGFIISVDQGPTPETNKFLIYKDLEYRGYFITENTKNTDGICIDDNILYAIDDDKRISKIKIT